MVNTKKKKIVVEVFILQVDTLYAENYKVKSFATSMTIGNHYWPNVEFIVWEFIGGSCIGI